jgi:MATE family multidrug resistance protein
MRNAMALSRGIFLGAWWLLAGPYANHGLWAALILCYLARGATLLRHYPAIAKAATRDPAVTYR